MTRIHTPPLLGRIPPTRGQREQATEYLLVYGTLLASELPRAPIDVAASLQLIGRRRIRGRLYDLGEYPGLVPGDDLVEAELHALADPGVLTALDAYEGFDPDDPQGSLFLRRSIRVPRFGTGPDCRWFDRQTIDAWVYTYNRAVDPAARIASGCWRAHLEERSRS